MSTRTGWVVAVLCASLVASRASALAENDDAQGFERTPPRLSFAEGEVSFWRPGAEEWTPARVNTALASGDELYSAAGANLELQIGPRAFLRTGASTQLGITSLEPDFLQIRVPTGQLSLDLRTVKAGQTIEIDTPNAAFSVERSGYYRVEVDAETTTFTSRRGGRAAVTPAQGESAAIAASEQVVVTGADAAQIETYAAPELDAWDRWNYARTDGQIDAVSARYIPSGVYGVDDLDHYGDWRVVPSYGAVWMPRAVALGWAPYSTGRWIYDPFYGWTWVDDAPWGWAPYHHGRWVYVSSRWGWCPGPIVARPYYAPALVAFYGGGGGSFGLSLAQPQVGWVALGWGEPLLPWWGPVGFRRHPHWAGWGGPRVVNDVVVTHQTVIHVNEIHVYRNAGVRDAIVVVDRDHFGRRSRSEVHFARAQSHGFEPLHGELELKPDRTSLAAATGKTPRPPRDAVQRTVVATRAPRPDPTPGLHPPRHAEKQREPVAESELPAATPPARIVEPPRNGRRIQVSDRPPFGRQGEGERSIAPPAPPFGAAQGEPAAPTQTRPATRAAPETPVPTPAPRPQGSPEPRSHGKSERAPAPTAAGPETALPTAPPPGELRSPDAAPSPRHPDSSEPRGDPQPRGRSAASHRDAAPAAPTPLPGEPANRVYRQHGESPRSQPPGPSPEIVTPQAMRPPQAQPRAPAPVPTPVPQQIPAPQAPSPHGGGGSSSRVPHGHAPGAPRTPGGDGES